jgi:hypothetical protein
MSIELLNGKTIIKIDLGYDYPDSMGGPQDHDRIEIECSDGSRFLWHHVSDCCEVVRLAEIVGDLDDLIGHQIISVEEVTESGENGDGTYTWTFYKIQSTRGHVTFRWLGESNGYYSESVDFSELN